jgi:creatinine amidohydrolase
VQLGDLTWPAVRDLAKTTPVVIPIAALEQHGHHLPVFTDSMLLGEVVRRAAEQLQREVLFTPLMWLGNSQHHLDFAGTLTAAPRTYLNLLGDLVENLLHHGFQRIVLLNGHGGNTVPSQQALFEARQRHRERKDLLLLAATYWTLPGDQPRPPGLTQSEMGHACEWETSMIVRIAPHLVSPLQNLSPVPQTTPFAPGHRAWVTQDRTTAGHIGDPRQATAEKGEQLLQYFSTAAVNWLRRVVAWDGRSWEG